LQKTKLTKEEKEKTIFYPAKNGGFVLGEESDFEVEVSFDKSEIEMLKEGFRKLEDGKKFTQANIGLALKIRDAKEITHTENVRSKK